MNHPQNHMASGLILSMVVLLVSSGFSSAIPTFEKKDFRISFQDGYAPQTQYPSTDSSFNVLDTASNSLVVLAGAHLQAGLSPSQFVASKTTAYKPIFERTDSTTKILGTNTFTVLANKEISLDSDQKSRLRIYYTLKNNFLFLAISVYDIDNEEAAMTRMEKALATLKITAGTEPRKDTAPKKSQ